MNVLQRLNEKVINHAQQADYSYKAFAIFNIFAHPIFYLIWKYMDTQGYENIYPNGCYNSLYTTNFL